MTALMLASRDGHTNIIQLLLEHGADANLQDKVSSSAKMCVSVCLVASAPDIQLSTPKLPVRLYVYVRARSSKVCDVSCLSEYECLALSKLVPRPH